MENSVENKTIGKYLSSIRENKNPTLEDISEITKIKVRLLKKVENIVDGCTTTATMRTRNARQFKENSNGE